MTDLRLLVHELRTPVASIRAAAAGLAREDLDPDVRARLTTIVSLEAARLARLLDDLGAADELQGGGLSVAPEPCDVVEVAEPIVEAAAARAHPPRRVRLAAGGVPLALAAPDRLAQVLANLVENALVHGEGDVEVAIAAAEGGVRVAVLDEGPGIPPGDRDRVFERDVRLEPTRPGTGLGLWLCRELVERQGGTIAVEDAPDGRAAIVVVLPAA
ncbi:MAG: HAMP domain-containing sensor histidine kinase [Thermoleophilia bacterium]